MFVLLARSDDGAAGLVYLLVYGGMFCFIIFLALWRYAKKTMLRGRAKSGGALPEIAAAFQGRVEPGEIPSVRFERKGHRWSYLQSVCEEGPVSVTTLEVDCGGKGLLDILSEKSPRSLRRTGRAKRIREWDSRFRIVTSDAAWAEAFMGAEFQNLLAGFAGWRWCPVRLRITTLSAILEIESFLDRRDAEQLVGFMERLLRLLGSGDSRGGVEILEAGPGPEAAMCQVCGTSLDGSAVQCGACRTPHHKDCWEYLGRCSTFGCRSRTAV